MNIKIKNKLSFGLQSLVGAILLLGSVANSTYAQYAEGGFTGGEVLGEQASGGIPTLYFLVALLAIALLGIIFFIFRKRLSH